MNSDQQNELERLISRELRALPDLKAPERISISVMAAIERRMQKPWYARSWDTWPRLQKCAALVFLTVLFAGLCAGGWFLARLGATNPAPAVSGWLGTASALVNAAIAVLRSLVQAVNQISPFILIGCFAAVSLGYAMFIAMGSYAVRLALSPSSKKPI